VERLARETYDTFGAAHVLCHNAGVAIVGTVHEHSLADWQWVINVNLWGVIHGVRAFLPRMLARGDEGHIVNTAADLSLLQLEHGPSGPCSGLGVSGHHPARRTGAAPHRPPTLSDVVAPRPVP
jgi:NAD(P)-dependent dehydrogenase (short-subunit alcohol dehydrogenase family)